MTAPLKNSIGLIPMAKPSIAFLKACKVAKTGYRIDELFKNESTYQEEPQSCRGYWFDLYFPPGWQS